MAPRSRITLGAVTLVAVAFSVGYVLRSSFSGATEAAGAWPRTSELDSLSAFLAATQADDAALRDMAHLKLSGGAGSVGLEAIDEPPPTAPRRDAPAPAPQPPERPPRKLTAILIAGTQRVAIIDEREVRPGDELPGGVEVVAIESDHVVLREPNGTRTLLRL